MSKLDRAKLITQICRLYYHNHLSQKDIADRFDISRSYVSKLLKDAEEMGIVTIQIASDFDEETPLELEIKERFGLQKAIVIPVATEDYVQKLGVLGAHLGRFLSSIIEDGDILGASWGRTIYHCSKHLVPCSAKNVVVTQLNGGANFIAADHKVHVDDVLSNFAKVYNASPYYLRAPAFVDTSDIRDAICMDMGIRRTLDMGVNSNILVLAAGDFNRESSLVRLCDFSVEEQEHMIRLGVVGDILSHLIDRNGEIVDTGYEERAITLPIDVLKQKPYRILVYVQRESPMALYGVLSGGYANVLLTDERTALSVMELDRNSHMPI